MHTTFPPKIDLLPEHLIDQIKAGEVIERPGNLIKEIFENAIDAGSTKIELTLKNNGLDLISLKDNGHGMHKDDLPLAFSRHATSKIQRFEDLYQLHSFGFRGEALASIASIAKIQCISYVANQTKGAEIKIEGGQTLLHTERANSSNTHGTELIIQDLFFNTPARLKFIQSQQSEKTFIKKIIFSFILAHPEIEFHIKNDDEDKDVFVKVDSIEKRIEQIISKSKDQILSSQKFYENNELQIFLLPSHLKSPVKWQNIYINNRYILDKQFHRVLTNALEASFGHANFYYLAFIHTNSDAIDVNVHPNKTIIKCLESSKILSLLTSTIKELASKRKVAPLPVEHKEVSQIQSFDFQAPNPPNYELKQERHQYNMEGFFSPHKLEENQYSFNWVKHFFIQFDNERTIAVNSKKLLYRYIETKLSFQDVSIPLMVSEPFKLSKFDSEIIARLNNAGAELEFLGKETLVLRSIPAWMNGFPLNGIFKELLLNKNFEDLTIIPRDWPSDIWQQMIDEITLPILLSDKIAINLEEVLKEKLK